MLLSGLTWLWLVLKLSRVLEVVTRRRSGERRLIVPLATSTIMFSRCLTDVRYFREHQEREIVKVVCINISCNLLLTLKILEFLKSEDMRVEMSMKFVAQCNPYARQKAGGQHPPPSVPSVIGKSMSCVLCVSRGTCLGKTCLGDNGKLHFPTLFTILFSQSFSSS